MSMIVGTVTVDPSTGVETYVPNDATNATKALYLLLLTENSSGTMMKKTGGGKATVNPDGTFTPPPPPTTSLQPFTVVPTPDFKAKQASIAHSFAQWMVTYILANAQVSVTIPASSGGDGLQTSASAGNPTTHPATPKTLAGSLT